MFYPNEIRTMEPPARKHYAWYELEENHPDGGMWQTVKALDRQRFVEEASDLMANPHAFVESMRLAVRKWPNSCGSALTNPSLNHRAWLGHAGCFLATGSPEETTRLAWHELDPAEQAAANAAADTVIAEWNRANAEQHDQMGLFDA